MKTALILAAAVLLIGGTAIAQTSSNTNPQQRRGVTGDATQVPPTVAEQQRCHLLATEQERQRCLAGNLPPGSQLTQSPQPAPIQPK